MNKTSSLSLIPYTAEKGEFQNSNKLDELQQNLILKTKIYGSSNVVGTKKSAALNKLQKEIINQHMIFQSHMLIDEFQKEIINQHMTLESKVCILEDLGNDSKNKDSEFEFLDDFDTISVD